jgi:hypothetical protein
VVVVDLATLRQVSNLAISERAGEGEQIYVSDPEAPGQNTVQITSTVIEICRNFRQFLQTKTKTIYCL